VQRVLDRLKHHAQSRAGQVLVDRLLTKGRAQGGVVRPVPGIRLLIGQQHLDGVAGDSRPSLVHGAQQVDHRAVHVLRGGPAQRPAHHPALQRLQRLVPLGGGRRRLIPAQQPQQERTNSGRIKRLDDAVIEDALDGSRWQLLHLLVDLGVRRELDQQIGDPWVRGQHVLAEVAEDAIGLDLAPQLHGKPIIEEHVDARPEQAPLCDGLTPIVAIERRPVVPVQPLDVRVLCLGDLEDEVLDKIGSKQRAAAVVERLEDDLGVIAGLQIDDDHLQVLTQRADQCIEPGGHLVRVAGDLGPVSDLLDEEGVRLRDPGGTQRRRDRGVVVHDHPERCLVPVSGPDLEHLVGVLGDLRIVQHQNPQCLGIHRNPVLLDDVLSGIQQQLQRGQSLLAIDDVADGDEACGDELLVKDDRSEEMRGHRCGTVARGRVEQAFGDRADVLPQRLPLVFKAPHVRPLEQRHDVADVVAEDPRWRERLSLHRYPLLDCPPSHTHLRQQAPGILPHTAWRRSNTSRSAARGRRRTDGQPLLATRRGPAVNGGTTSESPRGPPGQQTLAIGVLTVPPSAHRREVVGLLSPLMGDAATAIIGPGNLAPTTPADQQR
jgi:hypothetical protein